MPDEWRFGAELFNEGRYWEAHEAWEGPWSRATGDDRACLSALILLAAAMHKRLAHGSLTGRNFVKAMRYVEVLAPVYAGIDLRALARDVERALAFPDERPRLIF